jgi:hypothetical protein
MKLITNKNNDMNTNQMRNYNCKDEELPVICGYAAFSLKRDLADFSKYSPRFDQKYADEFDAKITETTELINPKSETAEKKAITARLYATMDDLTDPANRIEGYIKLAKNSIPLSVVDFGITLLRRKIRAKDTEGVLQSLRLVTANIQTYKEPLSAEGLTGEFIVSLENAATSIAADNQKQYEILSSRRELVQNNLYLLNDLFRRLTEICDIGKILYGKTAPQKVQEYTFSGLKKQVRNILKSKPAEKTDV